MTESVRNDRTASRYEVVVDGEVAAVIGYERSGDVLVLLHTGTEPQSRRRGYAARVVDAVVSDAAAGDLRLIVRCPFARSYLRSHPAPEPRPTGADHA